MFFHEMWTSPGLKQGKDNPKLNLFRPYFSNESSIEE